MEHKLRRSQAVRFTADIESTVARHCRSVSALAQRALSLSQILKVHKDGRPVLGCRSVSKESQNRYSRAAKDWGWREFLTLTTLFDADSGYLVNDAVEFAAEVLVLRESSETRHVSTPLLLAPSCIAEAKLEALAPGCREVYGRQQW